METRRKLKYALSSGQSEEGLTLIEMLVALNVIMGCVFFFSLALSQIQSVRASISDDRQIEWHLFLNMLEHDLRDTVLKDVWSTGFSVTKVEKGILLNKSVSYDVHKKIYRRVVNGEGHQPVLTKVKAFKVQQNNNQIQLDVTFENDESYNAWIKVEVLNE
ncbi:MAG: ComGF family competence protein [Alkalibacterium sp.]|nr:ComGF family competence protein [Alkalibacterium sp.]